MMPTAKAADATLAWWRSLQPDPPRQQGDRAALAKLRRCARVAEAMQEPAALMLFRRVAATDPGELPAIALAAAVLANIRKDLADAVPGMTTARRVGPDSLETPETALLKPLRFRRLMEAEGYDDRLAAFRRLAALAGGILPVRDLAYALLRWSDATRQRWVFDYWHVAAPSPAPQCPASPSAKDTTP
jgi:CRISPR system Cascade subunit CasB